MATQYFSIKDRLDLERVGAALRDHGINAFTQEDDIVVYAASRGQWTEVTRISMTGRYDNTTDEACAFILETLLRVTKGPHTH